MKLYPEQLMLQEMLDKGYFYRQFKEYSIHVKRYTGRSREIGKILESDPLTVIVFDDPISIHYSSTQELVSDGWQPD